MKCRRHFFTLTVRVGDRMRKLIHVDGCGETGGGRKLLGGLLQERQKPVKVNEDKGGLLRGIECFALDMDGTVYLGERWIDGAKDFLEAIERLGKRYVFVTNNSSKIPEVYVEKLGSDKSQNFHCR